MLDIDEILKQARQAKEQALASVKETMEKNEERISKIQVSSSEKDTAASADEVEEQIAANTQRQVEILGQIFGPDSMAQMAANEELLQKMVNDKAAEAASAAAGGLMEQLFGEDMGILAAALETLEMEDVDDEEERSFDLEPEENLYITLEEAMARIEAMPEPEPLPYQKEDGKWKRFGILLSGILSTLNSHDLDDMDVEEHIPVMEQKIVSLVRRSWGIDGRSDLLDMIRYLAQEGYILRYQLYSEAPSPEALMDETMDEDDRESVCRAWRFAQRYKAQYGPRFYGWMGYWPGSDADTLGMLFRLDHGKRGCWYSVGSLPKKLSRSCTAGANLLNLIIFGGLMWKLLCGDSSAGSYLGYLADAATDLLTGKAEQDNGQWRDCPWPAQRKIGFTL